MNNAALNLTEPKCSNIKHKNLDQLTLEWREKHLHGQHLRVQAQSNVDKNSSNLWLRIEDRVINTRNYQKQILCHDVVKCDYVKIPLNQSKISLIST